MNPVELTPEQQAELVQKQSEKIREVAKFGYLNALADLKKGKINREVLVNQLTLPTFEKWKRQSFMMKFKFGSEPNLMTQQVVSSKAKLLEKVMAAYNEACPDYEILEDYNKAEQYALDFAISLMEVDKIMFSALESCPKKEVIQCNVDQFLEHIEKTGKIAVSLRKEHWGVLGTSQKFIEAFDPIQNAAMTMAQGVIGHVVVNNVAAPKIQLSANEAPAMDNHALKRGIIMLTDAFFHPNMRMASEFVVAVDENFRFSETIVWSKEHKRFAGTVTVAPNSESSFDLYSLI